MTEEITTTPVFSTELGWAKAHADRPYYHDLTPDNVDNIEVTISIKQVPPPTNYKAE